MRLVKGMETQYSQVPYPQVVIHKQGIVTLLAAILGSLRLPNTDAILEFSF